MSQDIDNPTSPSSSYSTMDTGSLSLPEDDVSKKKRKSRTTNSPWFPKRKKKKVKKKPVEVEEDNQYEVEMIVDYKIEKVRNWNFLLKTTIVLKVDWNSRELDIIWLNGKDGVTNMTRGFQRKTYSAPIWLPTTWKGNNH